jgi:hypothetical protein
MPSFQQNWVPAALLALALAAPARAKGSDTERILVNRTAGTITLRPNVAALPRQVVGVTVFGAGSAIGMLHELDPRAGALPDLHLGAGDKASFVILQTNLTGCFAISFEVITDTSKANSPNNGTLIYAFNPAKNEAPKIKMEVHFQEGGGLMDNPNVQATPTRSDAPATLIELSPVKPAECCTIL